MFPPLLMNNYEYNTPYYFLLMCITQTGVSGFNLNNLSDKWSQHTNTKINPAIFIGDSEDDWMNCLEVVQEICKIYGIYIWQDGSRCIADNILLYDLSNPYTIRKEDYMADDANISVDEAYNVIKCEVDISDVDDEFINPFDKEEITPTTNPHERYMTEIIVKGRNKEALTTFRMICDRAYLDDFGGDWSKHYGSVLKNSEIYDTYVKVLENPLFEFTQYNALGTITRPSYLDDISDGGGGGRATSNAKQTLDWLKNHPGRGAFLAYGSTDNLLDQKDKDSVTVKDLTKCFVIQIGGHCEESDTEKRRIESQIQNNMPICEYKLNSSNNIIPNDPSTINYILINGKILLNPVQLKTGISWVLNYEPSRNTVKESVDTWGGVNWSSLYIETSNNTQYHRCIGLNMDDDNPAYYQNYAWANDVYSANEWPYNQTAVCDQKDMFFFPLHTGKQQFKWQGSYYNKDNPSEIDDLAFVPMIACELKIGDKYLCEDMAKIKEFNWQSLTPAKLQQMYKWMTASEAANAGLPTHFSIGIDPAIGDYIIGKENSIKQTTNVTFGLQDNGFALPIPYTAGLIGTVSFKILGPVNAQWDDVGYDKSGWWFWRDWWTTHTNKTVLTYVENIIIKDFEFKIVSDNQKKEQLNDDNDLVYYSVTQSRYTDDKDFSCKFCTSLTTPEVNDLGIDYNINNSSILGLDNLPWYGMKSYKDTVYSQSDNNYSKLEEARVSEQYAFWSKPRNIIEATVKLINPDLCYIRDNFAFNYLSGVYKITAREIDLKQGNMKCTFKDFS
jgi:hypothetical protein